MAIGKTGKRRQAILGIVSGGDVNVEALSRHFNVSRSTIRRDLAELALNGRVLRTCGGAALPGALAGRQNLHVVTSNAGRPGLTQPGQDCGPSLRDSAAMPLNSSTGSGNTMVDDLSPAMLDSVCM